MREGARVGTFYHANHGSASLGGDPSVLFAATAGCQLRSKCKRFEADDVRRCSCLWHFVWAFSAFVSLLALSVRLGEEVRKLGACPNWPATLIYDTSILMQTIPGICRQSLNSSGLARLQFACFRHSYLVFFISSLIIDSSRSVWIEMRNWWIKIVHWTVGSIAGTEG